MQQFIVEYFLNSGIGLAVVGAMLAVMLGGLGSARGLRITGAQTAGVLSEKPELFGRLLVLTALPGTQGFYGLITAIMIARQIKLMEGAPICPPLVGFSLLFIGLCAGAVLYRSAIFQGETSAACINLTSRKPDEAGRAILFPALVETYAVVALLAAILMIFWLTAEKVVTALSF